MPRGRPKGSKNKKQQDASTVQSGHAGAVDTRSSNVGERRKEIQAGLRALYQLDRDIAELVEEQVKPLREDKSRIKDGLRERFGLTAKMIQARYYSFRIEQDALYAKDEVTLDALRELFEVCPVTGQGSMAAALDSTIQKPAAGNGKAAAAQAEETHDPEAAWQAGYEARKDNLPLDSCPFTKPHQTKLKARFEEGWDSAEQEINQATGGRAANQLPA